MKTNPRHELCRILLLLAGVLPSACTNISSRVGTISTTGNPAVLNPGAQIGGSYTHEMKNVAVSANAGQNGGAAEAVLSLSVDAGLAGFRPLTQFCGVGGVNLCLCELKWTQATQDGVATYERTRRLVLASVQSGIVTCSMPSGDWGEIGTGTVIQVNILPGNGNATGLRVRPIGYKKGNVANANGDFLDDTLTPFRNIHRYTCHSKRTNAHEILNKFVVSTGPDEDEIRTLVGSCFCSGGQAVAANGGAGDVCSTLQCPTGVREGFSSQNYYRNFYVRSDRVGSIVSSNNTYDCPKVLESVKVSATSSGGATTVPDTEKSKYWPLDTTFALASEWSSDWSIGVRAASTLTNGANAQTDACTNAGTSFVENGIMPRCLGYARKPKSDGTCGSIRDSNGRQRPLVRLRRYRALLPARYNRDGRPEGAQGANGGGANTTIYPAVDEVYVADRLVLDANAIPNGDMIYGPKPCNYAWFDHEGVAAREASTLGGTCDSSNPGANDFGSNLNSSTQYAQPRYVSTEKFYKNGAIATPPSWSESLSVNPDGLVFPNRDQYGGGVGTANPAFCSASLPVVNYSMGSPSGIDLFLSHLDRNDSFSLGGKTIHKNEIHLRPADPWVPQYVEDTSFEACAPIADPYLEPPLHFYRDADKNIAWCAEVYPNQNPYWATINRKRRLTAAGNGYDQTVVNYANNAPTSCNSAHVKGYTLHQDTIGTTLGLANRCTGTPAQAVCDMTDPSAANCSTFLGRYDSHKDAATADTCDRTVMFDPAREYRDFPLQASDADIDSMLANDLTHDKSFACSYSVSRVRSRVNRGFPSTGCCGKFQGQTVLGNLLSGGAAQGGHLEPLLDGAAPNVRFCGSPVE